MDDDTYKVIKKGIENKKQQTEKEYALNKLKIREKEEEAKDKFNYFSNEIFNAIFQNINLLEEYKKSDNFQNLIHSDAIIKKMKIWLLNLDYDKLVYFSEKDFKFTKESEKLIISEIKNNYKSFYINFIISNKAKAFESIGKIKNKFEEIYTGQEFDLSKYTERIIDLEFKKDEIKEIENMGIQIFLKKMKELINKELEDYK
jgi:hypothetical protein